jgi:hypothetical protein
MGRFQRKKKRANPSSLKVHDRLKRAVILNRPVIEVIRSQDGPETYEAKIFQAGLHRGSYGGLDWRQRGLRYLRSPQLHRTHPSRWLQLPRDYPLG